MPSAPGTPSQRDDVTRLLQAAAAGDARRAATLLRQVYDELHRLACSRMRAERSDHTLQATALVHEAYVRLVGERRVPWQNRAHFFAAAAESMRRILLDHARARGAARRGGRRTRVPLHVLDLAAKSDSQEILSLDDAISRLNQQDPETGRIVQLRFFAGLSITDTAAATGLSAATVKRRWEFARTWLFRELSKDER